MSEPFNIVHFYAHDAANGNRVPSTAETACAISLRHALAFPTLYGAPKFIASAQPNNVTCERCKARMVAA